MTAQMPQLTKTLYDQDFCLWLEETAEVLQSGRFSELDITNLAEEILDMGKSQKQALKSNLVVLLMHLLKYKYQPNKRSNSWKATIREHRRRLRDAFTDSPSLKRYFSEVFDGCYQDAREQAADETGLPIEIFVIKSPFGVEEILNPDYLPE